MKSRQVPFFLYWRVENVQFWTNSIAHLGWLSRISNFPRFHKNVNSPELWEYISENSSPKGSFWRNKRKSEFSVLSWDSPYIYRQWLLVSHFSKMAVTWLWTFKNFKIDCVSFIFLQVFDVSYFNLGGSIEPPSPPPPPPLDPLQSSDLKGHMARMWTCLPFLKMSFFTLFYFIFDFCLEWIFPHHFLTSYNSDNWETGWVRKLWFCAQQNLIFWNLRLPCMAKTQSLGAINLVCPQREVHKKSKKNHKR